MAKISLYRGDITALEVDAIVNAANDRLWMGGGVAGAIKRAGGEEIEREAVAKGPVPVGEAVVTGAGKLKAKYVIHAVVMGQDRRTDAAKIRAATESGLKRAEELGIKSIAFPALGTGVGGLPYAEAAKVMIGAVREHLAGETCLEEVIFALYGEEAYKAFEQELARR
ncbi:MAG TPA: macro domain-containing protein [Anaerolineae bacterium]|nr:macro domain-containing protein [Anaerolineae bacterium]